MNPRPNESKSAATAVANRWGLPDLGLGVGLRTPHFRHITEKWPAMDWFEIVSENFIDTEGRPLYFLDQIAERYPIVMHGVSLSVGSTDPVDFGFLDKLKALARARALEMARRPHLLDRASPG